MPSATNAVERVLAHEQELLAEWVALQHSAGTRRTDLIKDSELQSQSREFLSLFREAFGTGSAFSLTSSDWTPARDFLAGISHSRAMQGFSPSETALFVLSLKQPVFFRLQKALESSPDELAESLWRITTALDTLALYTTDVFQQSRQGIIQRQQQELLELSTPVVDLWAGILALPLVGTLDSARTQVVMESLLQAIVRTGATVAIIDITGVPTVDTLVAQHLLKTVAAARLMGADCIISGIRPQIAQTIVHLGVDLSEVATKATLADAFTLALRKTNAVVQ